MTTYHVILAYDVPCYHTVVIEAQDQDEAYSKAEELLKNADSSLFEPDWSASDDYRIADIIDATDLKEGAK